jgi:hypothetical protein
MKKIIITLSVLFALSLAGILYGTPEQPDEEGMVTIEEMYLSELPDQMPDVVMDPMVGFPLY